MLNPLKWVSGSWRADEFVKNDKRIGLKWVCLKWVCPKSLVSFDKFVVFERVVTTAFSLK